MSGNTSKRHSAELKARAMRMYAEVRLDHVTDLAAMGKVAEMARGKVKRTTAHAGPKPAGLDYVVVVAKGQVGDVLLGDVGSRRGVIPPIVTAIVPSPGANPQPAAFPRKPRLFTPATP